jgi:GcrA cell cycle regulator
MNFTSNFTQSAWSDDRIVLLRKGYDAGKAYAEIGMDLGITANAVNGKIHRLGWPQRQCDRDRLYVGIKKIRKIGAAKGEPSAVHIIKEVKRIKADVPETLGPDGVPPTREDDLAIPRRQRITSLLEFEWGDKKCRWPIGDVGTEGFFFCGGKQTPGMPYCAKHCRVAFYTPVKRDRPAQRG